jgi:hydrogenase nickel incorporation protein HypA/HybF
MHEVSIALNLLEIVEEKCREEGYASVKSLKVKIGTASGVLPEALQFAFASAKRDSIAGNAELVIDLIPLRGICQDCAGRFEWPASYIFECPLCKSPSFRVLSGYEMELAEIEVP